MPCILMLRCSVQNPCQSNMQSRPSKRSKSFCKPPPKRLRSVAQRSDPPSNSQSLSQHRAQPSAVIPVRAKVFRQGQTFNPPAIHRPTSPTSTSCEQSMHRSGTPGESFRYPEAANRLLDQLEAVDQRVRLLLPGDASIVFPGSSPSPKRPRLVAPNPHPELWANHYVSILFM